MYYNFKTVLYHGTVEWLDFILMCREQGEMPHDFDLVVGPTADDDTILCLKAYWNGHRNVRDRIDETYYGQTKNGI